MKDIIRETKQLDLEWSIFFKQGFSTVDSSRKAQLVETTLNMPYNELKKKFADGGLRSLSEELNNDLEEATKEFTEEELMDFLPQLTKLENDLTEKNDKIVEEFKQKLEALEN